MRFLITGATGTAGSSALREAMAEPRVDSVAVVGRRPPPHVGPKVVYLGLPDLGNWKPLAGRLGGIDAVLWCLGISQSSVSREELSKITVDFTLAGAEAILRESPGVTFLFLSGGGADPSGKSRLPFAREKGRAENALDRMGFRRLYHVRPAYIHPEVSDHKKPWTERLMAGLEPVVRGVAPATVIGSRELGRAMVRVALDGHPKRVLENRELRKVAGLTRGV